MKVTCPQCKRRIRIRRGEQLTCKCKKILHYRHFFRNRISYVVYLIDANIFIYAETKKDRRYECSRKALNFTSDSIKIGTTDVILSEVKTNDSLPILDQLIVYKTGKLTDEIASLRTNFLKQPSPADLSLVQAAMEHPEVKGIITYDRDFGRIAAQGIIQKRSATTLWLGNASAFLKKYEIQALQPD